MARRVILLVAAALVAALGAGMVFVYASSSQDTAAAATESSKVTVYTASAQIDPGASGLAVASVSAPVQVDAASVPAGAVSDVGQLANLKAITTVFKGQILISSQFGDNNITGGLPVPAGQLGVSVALSDPARVAGFVQPGSKVTIYGTKADKTTVILENVTVLAVGPSTMTTQTHKSNGSSTTTEQTAQAPLTLAVTKDQGALLVANAAGGQLWFGLQPK